MKYELVKLVRLTLNPSFLQCIIIRSGVWVASLHLQSILVTVFLPSDGVRMCVCVFFRCRSGLKSCLAWRLTYWRRTCPEKHAWRKRKSLDTSHTLRGSSAVHIHQSPSGVEGCSAPLHIASHYSYPEREGGGRKNAGESGRERGKVEDR